MSPLSRFLPIIIFFFALLGMALLTIMVRTHEGTNAVVTPGFDTTNNPYHESRRDLFELLPDTHCHLLFIGTSITVGFPAAEIFPVPRVLIRAMSGAETTDFLPAINALPSCDTMVVELGTNDIKNKIDHQKSILAYRLLLKGLKKKCENIYVLSVLPTNRAKRVEDYNRRLRELCKSERIGYINAYAAFDSSGVMKGCYTYDGLHLTSIGYQELAQVISKNLSLPSVWDQNSAVKPAD